MKQGGTQLHKYTFWYLELGNKKCSRLRDTCWPYTKCKREHGVAALENFYQQ